MAITLELTPEQEEQLRDTAQAKGLTVEGYLLTLVEAIVQPKVVSHANRPGYRRAFARLFRTGTSSPIEGSVHPDEVVRESVRQMRKSVLEYKERAVDAVTTMNMLRSAVALQERQVAEKELQALRALAEHKREQAKRRWQEKMVRERHLEAVKQELITAIAAADERTRAFRQEEERAQARASQAQMGALKAYEAVMLPPDRIAPLIQALHTEAEWEQAFEEWILQATQEPAETRGIENLPDSAPVDDLEAFGRKVRNLAGEARSDVTASDRDFKNALNPLSGPTSVERAAPGAALDDYSAPIDPSD
ncbi:MAG: hypothetical protein JWL77_4479 [Chthonomonadaceae bacterium]|nr:hypothetical protein [Chthonomonadaceae bacterium]